jgi:hypothetical protein
MTSAVGFFRTSRQFTARRRAAKSAKVASAAIRERQMTKTIPPAATAGARVHCRMQRRRYTQEDADGATEIAIVQIIAV